MEAALQAVARAAAALVRAQAATEQAARDLFSASSTLEQVMQSATEQAARDLAAASSASDRPDFFENRAEPIETLTNQEQMAAEALETAAEASSETAAEHAASDLASANDRHAHATLENRDGGRILEGLMTARELAWRATWLANRASQAQQVPNVPATVADEASDLASANDRHTHAMSENRDGGPAMELGAGEPQAQQPHLAKRTAVDKAKAAAEAKPIKGPPPHLAKRAAVAKANAEAEVQPKQLNFQSPQPPSPPPSKRH